MYLDLAERILSVFFFLLVCHALFVNYFQVVRVFLVFSFFLTEFFTRTSVSVILFYLQIVSSIFFSLYQNHRIELN